MLKPNKDENLKIKQFGYVVSAILLILSNIGLVNKWAYTPLIFILTMYFLTGSLWAPKLIRGFYNGLRKYFFKDKKNNSNSDNLFSEN